MAEVKRISGVSALLELVGQSLGTGEWFTVDQQRIQAFADATGDHQWIHLDVERSKRESPYGTTIAHGYLTLSLLPMLCSQVFDVDGVSARINYGLNRLRFPAPVPSGSQIRVNLRLLSVEPQDGGRYMVTTEAAVELKDNPRPACVAEMVALYIV